MANAVTLNLTEDLSRALDVHCEWKQFLRAAACNRIGNLPIGKIHSGYDCKLNRWLQQLPAELRGAEEAKQIAQLNARVHRAAAIIAIMINEGLYDRALNALCTGSFPQLCSELTRALASWRIKTILAG